MKARTSVIWAALLPMSAAAAGLEDLGWMAGVMRVVDVREGFVLFENVAPNPDEPRRFAYERNGSRMTFTVTDPPGAVTDQIGGTAGTELVFELQLAGGR